LVKSFSKSLLESVVVLIGISIVLWLLNKIEVDARGIDNVISESQYNSFAFVFFFDLEVFNIAFSILIIVLIIYIFVKTALRK
jgi:branched-subunit amino acid ABC-type transport system permease component